MLIDNSLINIQMVLETDGSYSVTVELSAYGGFLSNDSGFDE